MEDTLFVLAAAACRVGGCFLVLPGLSSARVPVQVRLFMALGVAYGVAAGVAIPVTGEGRASLNDTATLVRLVATESAIGLVFGLLGRFWLSALAFGAAALATAIGYSNPFGAGIDAAEPQEALGSMISMSALLLLFQLDFHHLVIRALAESYAIVPPLGAFDTGAVLDDLLATLARAFAAALQLAGPFVAYAMVANLAVGVLNRLTPQVPIYFVGLPAIIAGGLLILLLIAPDMLRVFVERVLGAPAWG